MFTLPLIKNCPVTRMSRSTILLNPKVVEQLNGLLYGEPSLEWAAIGKGRSYDSGLRIEIDSLWIPGQRRSHSSVDILEFDPAEDDICVFHSHHSMGAFFSGTDVQKLNDRFQVSIVVANIKEKSSEWEKSYGFSYEATTQIELPCGSLGRVPAELIPPTILLDSPWEEVSWKKEDYNSWQSEHFDLFHTDSNVWGDCNNFHVERDKHLEKLSPGCNWIWEKDQTITRYAEDLFGRDPKLLSQLPPPSMVAHPSGVFVSKRGDWMDEAMKEVEACLPKPKPEPEPEPDNWRLISEEEDPDAYFKTIISPEDRVEATLDLLNKALRTENESKVWEILTSEDFIRDLMECHQPYLQLL